jgi:hypothetical protein
MIRASLPWVVPQGDPISSRNDHCGRWWHRQSVDHDRPSRVLTHAAQLPNPDFYSGLGPAAHQMARTEVAGDGA